MKCNCGQRGFSWSLLDFGQSYFAAKQNADRVLVAQERRRKALHNLVQDVRTAFWRVVAAQTLSASVRATINDAEGVLRDAQSAEQERLRNPLEPLRFQRQILENLKLTRGTHKQIANWHHLSEAVVCVIEESALHLACEWLSLSKRARQSVAQVLSVDGALSALNIDLHAAQRTK